VEKARLNPGRMPILVRDEFDISSTAKEETKT
jgi:hypothetical protein